MLETKNNNKLNKKLLVLGIAFLIGFLPWQLIFLNSLYSDERGVLIWRWVFLPLSIFFLISWFIVLTLFFRFNKKNTKTAKIFLIVSLVVYLILFYYLFGFLSLILNMRDV